MLGLGPVARALARLAPLTLVGLGCGVLGVTPPSEGGDPEPPDTGLMTDSSRPSGSADDDGSEDETSSVMAEEGFMTAAQDSGEGGDACPLVDILFVVDNSQSMMREQETLAVSIDGFISGIEAQLSGDNDFHLGVVTTDAYQHNPEGCRELGDLVTQTPAGACGPFSDGNFMTPLDPLEEGFACTSQVGIDGSFDERPLDAAIAALDPANACNAGFARDDALLVLVIITDEDDVAQANTDNLGSMGEPIDWYEQIVDRRGGVADNVVVLSIIGVDEPNGCSGDEQAEPAERIAAFTQMFPFWQVADVCDEEYASFFEDALSLVYVACSGFTPPG